MKVIQYYIFHFDICERKNHKHPKNTLIHKAKQYMSTVFFHEKSTYLEESASSVQVDILNT